MRHQPRPKPQSAVRNPQCGRPGFTLIEILVTIGIIVLLVSILAATFGGMFGTARAKATRGTIEKINGLMKDRIEAVNRSIEGGELKKLIIAKVDQNGNKYPTEELARIVVRKIELKKAFPQAWAEVSTAPPSPNTLTPEADSSEVLYWVLTQGPVYGISTVGADSFVANEIKDTDGDGLLEFVDAWERPLRFYRWPTRLVRPEGAGTPVNKPLVDLLIAGTTAEMLDFDPDDPKRIFRPSNFEQDFHTPQTYHSLLLLSAGEDGDTGLREPTDFTTTDDHTANTGFGYLAHPSSAVATAVVDNGGDPGDTPLADNITNHEGLGNE